MHRATTIAAGGAFVFALTAHFLFETVAGSGVADVGAAVIGALVAVVTVCVASGVPSRQVLSSIGARDWLALGSAGALALVAAPFTVLANRYSSAPSGAEVLFFTTTVWGVVVLVGTALFARKAVWAGLAGAVTAVAGNAAMLASWEVPSSFSPMVRFAREEVSMALAALGWVALSVVLSRHSERLGRRTTLFVAAAGACLAAALLAVVRWSDVVAASSSWSVHLPLGLALGAMAVAWSHLDASIGSARAAGAFFLPPLAISAISGLEHLVARTPQPMLLPRVAAASAVTIIGVVAVMACSTPAVWPQGAARRLLAGASTAVLAVAAIALALPGLTADLTGRMETGEAFNATWSMLGAETAGGWLALAAALWLLWSALGGGWSAAASGVGVLAAYPWLRDVPLRTWTRWVPSKIQQDYGTEYARLAFEPISAPAQRAAAGAAGLLLLAALGLALAGKRATAAGTAGHDTEAGA